MRDEHKQAQIFKTKMVTDICLMAGKMLMESGAETYRPKEQKHF